MKYPKILELGATPILDIFRHDVIVEEKVDGSLFPFGKTKKGEFLKLLGRQPKASRVL